mmetsp:Transcript_9207/g.23252  ORF Transcript_9207/g.23252 Transcript_9207/m.23252 type:complete len:317 (-) Transcript_9207:183-1133(-)
MPVDAGLCQHSDHTTGHLQWRRRHLYHCESRCAGKEYCSCRGRSVRNQALHCVFSACGNTQLGGSGRRERTKCSGQPRCPERPSKRRHVAVRRRALNSVQLCRAQAAYSNVGRLGDIESLRPHFRRGGVCEIDVARPLEDCTTLDLARAGHHHGQDHRTCASNYVADHKATGNSHHSIGHPPPARCTTNVVVLQRLKPVDEDPPGPRNSSLSTAGNSSVARKHFVCRHCVQCLQCSASDLHLRVYNVRHIEGYTRSHRDHHRGLQETGRQFELRCQHLSHRTATRDNTRLANGDGDTYHCRKARPAECGRVVPFCR